MKITVSRFLLLSLIILYSATVYANTSDTAQIEPTGISIAPPEMPEPQAQAPGRGGYMAGLKTLLFGPRVGLEANENTKVTFVEKANLFVPLAPFQAYGVNGIKGFFAAGFLGPRVGMQLQERRIRMKEWLGLIPIVAVAYHLFTSDPSTSMIMMEVSAAGLLSRILPAFEAFKGRTMTEIERRENLRKN